MPLRGRGAGRIFRVVTVRRALALIWLVVLAFASTAQAREHAQPWGASDASYRVGAPGALERLWVELQAERLTEETESPDVGGHATFTLLEPALVRTSYECANSPNSSPLPSVLNEPTRSLERARGPPAAVVSE